MKYMLSLLALGYVALASPAPSLPVHPGGIGGLFKGPNSETIIKGPDGSIITAAAEGGAVISEPIVVAPEVVEVAAPVVQAVAATPVVQAIAAAPVVEAVAVADAVVERELSSDLIGPSGRIATQGSRSIVAGPASTTITGPAIVAETVVKGTPIIGAPAFATATAVPLDITASLVPVSVTPAPLATITAEIAPLSITARPIATVTASPWPALGRTAIVSAGPRLPIVAPSIQTVTATPPIIVTASSPRALATDGGLFIGSGLPNRATVGVDALGRIPTVTATPLPIFPSTLGPIGSNGAIGSIGPISASGPVGAIGSIDSLGPIGSVGPLGSIGPVGPIGSIGINNRADLRPQLIHDQVAIDNRQLNLNPIAIPARGLIPPEIAVTQRIPIGRLRPTPVSLLTTPGLGAVGTSTNIQREEGDIALSVTPPTLQINPGLTQQLLNIQTQQNLLNNQIQHAQQAGGPRDALGLTLGVTPNSLQVNPQVSLTQEEVLALQNQQILLNNQVQPTANAGLGTLSVTPNSLQVNPQVRLTQEEVLALQNQQTLLNNQVQPTAGAELGTLSVSPNSLQINPQVGLTQEQALALQNQQLLGNQVQPTAGAELGNPEGRLDGRLLFTPNRQDASLASIQQQNLLSSELSRSGIDASQVQLTNVPLSAVTAIPGRLDGANLRGGINNGLNAEAWGRYGRDTDKEKKGGKKAKEKD